MRARSTVHAKTSVAIALTALCALPLAAPAQPQTGVAFPAFTAPDLVGGRHSSRELVGHRTLVVAITDPDAGDAMQAWFDTAKHRGLEGPVRLQSLFAFNLPVFATDGLVRARAKGRVPPQYWRATWYDKHGALQRTLGLQHSMEPYAFALDGQGRVLASAHGAADGPGANAVWTALAR